MGENSKHIIPSRQQGDVLFAPGNDSSTSQNEDNLTSKSPENIREALNLMQLAMVETGEEKIYIKTRNNALGSAIFKALGLKLPANVSREEQLEGCFRIGQKPLWGQLSLF